MSIIRYSLFASCCLMFGLFGSLHVACCCSFVVRCVVCGVLCLLFVCLFVCSVIVACHVSFFCLLFVVMCCCWLFV